MKLFSRRNITILIGGLIIGCIVIGWLYARWANDPVTIINKTLKKMEDYHNEVKNDPKRLSEARNEQREAAIQSCDRLKERWDFSKLKNGSRVENAIDSAKDASEDAIKMADSYANLGKVMDNYSVVTSRPAAVSRHGNASVLVVSATINVT